MLSHARRLPRILKPSILINSTTHRNNIFSDNQSLVDPPPCHKSESQHISPHSLRCFVGIHDFARYSASLSVSKAFYSTEAGTSIENDATEAVKELHAKICDSVNNKRTMAPNVWLWSLIENCRSEDDVKLLFDALKSLRRFRLSHLRIHDNFNCNLCREVAKRCAHVGAIEFGKKTLWTHNVFGLSPSVASANHLLTYAKDRNDVKLMVDIMKLIRSNNIPLQPSTADIVFSICYDTDNWELLSKYSRRFVKAGVKLRKTAFDKWMNLAAKRGDTASLWEIEKLRFNSYHQHTLVSGFSCAKGLILEHKPDEAAVVIQALDQTLPEAKKSGIMVELEKLVSQWPLDVIKHQAEDNKKGLATSLKSNIPVMVAALLNMGMKVDSDMEKLTSKIPC